MPRSIGEFNIKEATGTGGHTGSMQVTDFSNNNPFQLKFSILDNEFLRRLKAQNTDRENIGEFLAATILRSIVKELLQADPNEENREEIIPEVVLVLNFATGRVLIASKYLSGDKVRTLDDYAKELGLFEDLDEKKAHITVVNKENANPGEWFTNSEEFTPLKPTLALALALSALVGDHDVNPGNMLVITKEGKNHIARIDFGHAFNDLLNAPALFGGGLLNPKHPVKDFFNRDYVAGLPMGAPSKLWRDYPGFAFSSDNAIALKKVGNVSDQAIESGIHEAQKELIELLEIMINNNDNVNINHVLQSLHAIHNNISKNKVDQNIPPLKQMEIILEGIGSFVKQNRDNAKLVSKIMTIQLGAIEKLAQNEPLPSLLENPGIEKTDRIRWIKESKDNEAYFGTFSQYVINKKITMDLENEPRDLVNNIAKNALTTIEDYRNKILKKLSVDDSRYNGFILIEKMFDDILLKLAMKDLNSAYWTADLLAKTLKDPKNNQFYNLKSQVLQITESLKITLKNAIANDESKKDFPALQRQFKEELVSKKQHEQNSLENESKEQPKL